LLIIAGFLAIMATGFETLWSFFYWFAILGQNQATDISTLDSLDYRPQYNLLLDQVNLNFSAKKNVFLLFSSIYFTYFMHGIKQEKTRKSKIS